MPLKLNQEIDIAILSSEYGLTLVICSSNSIALKCILMLDIKRYNTC